MVVKSHFLSVIGAAISILTTASSCSNLEEEKEINQGGLPNIVLLTGDDHGLNDVGYNGHPFVKTPVLDEMAASSLRFWLVHEFARSSNT